MATSSIVGQLRRWSCAFYSDPLGFLSEFASDLQYFPNCLKEFDDWCLTVVGVCVLGCLLLVTWFYFLYKILSCARKKSPGSDALRRFQKRELEEIEKKKKEKLGQEKSQKTAAASVADDLLDIYNEVGIQYNKDRPLPDMGSRLDKYWYRVTSQETYACHILTVGSISTKFTCDLKVEGYINEQLKNLQHPYLQTINEIKFLTKKDKKQVAILQPYWEKGSLKDLIYKASPVEEWAQKYNKLADGLPPKKVALFGSQILEAVVYLYGRGYDPLGHIQTGNIYVVGEDSCKLGGYENTLLKYRARLYRTCANLKCLDDIDVVMFGHVIYEMSAGHELSRLAPNDNDYCCIEDEGCKEILHYIFERKEGARFKRGIIKIQSHWFFGGTGPDHTDIEPSVQLQKSRQLLQRAKKAKKLVKNN